MVKPFFIHWFIQFQDSLTHSLTAQHSTTHNTQHNTTQHSVISLHNHNQYQPYRCVHSFHDDIFFFFHSLFILLHLFFHFFFIFSLNAKLSNNLSWCHPLNWIDWFESDFNFYLMLSSNYIFSFPLRYFVFFSFFLLLIFPSSFVDFFFPIANSNCIYTFFLFLNYFISFTNCIQFDCFCILFC